MSEAEEKAKYIDKRFKISEKGIDYFNKTKGIHNVVGVDHTWLSVFSDAYEIGYNDLSTENAKLKEALREIVKECEEWVITGAETSNNCENNHYVEIDDLKSLITKAKQLLNKE